MKKIVKYIWRKTHAVAVVERKCFTVLYVGNAACICVLILAESNKKRNLGQIYDNGKEKTTRCQKDVIKIKL
jgi:hypothetical protein